VYKKKGNRTSARYYTYVNYSAYEQLVFIFGKIRLLAIEWHAFHAKWRKNKHVRGRIINNNYEYVRRLVPKGVHLRFWLTFFIEFVFANFLSTWHEEDIIQQLKAWSFRMWKNLVHTQSNSDTIARWSSMTFFLYTLYRFCLDAYVWHIKNKCPSKYFRDFYFSWKDTRI
jgi:hypothetical protein